MAINLVAMETYEKHLAGSPDTLYHILFIIAQISYFEQKNMYVYIRMYTIY